MIYLQLLISFFQIGLFSIGGGYAALPLIQEQVVDVHQWLTLGEYSDLITISQMTPGPIAINTATFVGNQIAGLPGSILATFGCVLPSFIIVLILAYFYFKYKNIKLVQGILSGLRPVVVALIASAALSIFTLSIWGEEGFSLKAEDLDFIAVGLFAVSLFALRKWRVNQIVVMLCSGIVGMLLYLL